LQIDHVATVDVALEEACSLLWIPPLSQEIITCTRDVAKINKTRSPLNFSVKFLKTTVKSRCVPLDDDACHKRMLDFRVERMISSLGVKNNVNADIMRTDFSKTPVNGKSICRIFDVFDCATDKFSVAEAVAQLSVAIGELCKSLELIAMNLCANSQLVTALLTVLIISSAALFGSSDVANSVDNSRSYDSGLPEMVVR
jgi:hypothetical protein